VTALKLCLVGNIRNQPSAIYSNSNFKMKILTIAFSIFVVCLFGGCATPQAPFIPDVASIESIKHIALIVPPSTPAVVRVARSGELPPSLVRGLTYQTNKQQTIVVPVQTTLTPTQAAVGNLIANLVIAGMNAGIESGNKTKQEAYTNAMQNLDPAIDVTQEFFKSIKRTFIERGYRVSEVASLDANKLLFGDADAFLETRFWYGYFAGGMLADYKRYGLMSAQLRRTSDQSVLNSIDSQFLTDRNDDYQFGNNEALMGNFPRSVTGLVSLAQQSGEAVVNIMTPNTAPKNSSNMLGLTRVFITPYAGEVPKTTYLTLTSAPPKTVSTDIAKVVIESQKLPPPREPTTGAEPTSPRTTVEPIAIATPVNLVPQDEAKVIVEPPKTIPPTESTVLKEPVQTTLPVKANVVEPQLKTTPYLPPPVAEEKDPLAEYGREVILSEPEPETKPKSKSTPKPKPKPKQ
jgi:uncharacterized lipoprotein YajG